MQGPMEGMKVVEVGMWVAGPAAAAILGDWGADVIKIEPPDGDPFRGLMSAFGGDGSSPPFELDNRNKRSVALNLSTEEGRAIAQQLVADADVFVTNARPVALERAGLDYETLRALNPRLVYAQVNGYGMEGEDRDRAAYDVGAFWSRAGVAAALAPEGTDLPYQRGGMGDHMAGMAAAGGIAAALLARERTGEGQLVSTSLMRIGMYMIGWDISMSLRLGVPTTPMSVKSPPNPLINGYTTGDGKRFWMLGLQGDRHWPDVVRALDRPEWADDPRFDNIVARALNSAELVKAMNEVLATKTLAEWGEIFDRENVWWAPVQEGHDVVNDPVALSAGGFVDVPDANGGEPIKGVASPVDFFGTPAGPRATPPEFAQHTEEVLLELGYDWDQIIELKAGGAIP
ncbi:MAG TPA: CoA transferase [Acidimicrobiales bacterium]|nr:CoA transferase [Acidimicrobiales bacterium]